MKQIYIAAPFFDPGQLAIVESIERAISGVVNLKYYSPRKDGILKDMNADQRRAAGPNLFKLNVRMITESDVLVCVLDQKDVGTAWEMGFAFNMKKPIIGYTTVKSELNIMLQQCVHGHAHGTAQLQKMLAAYDAGKLRYEPKAMDNVI